MAVRILFFVSNTLEGTIVTRIERINVMCTSTTIIKFIEVVQFFAVVSGCNLVWGLIMNNIDAI